MVLLRSTLYKMGQIGWCFLIGLIPGLAEKYTRDLQLQSIVDDNQMNSRVLDKKEEEQKNKK